MMYAYAIYIHKGAVTLVFTNQKSLSFDLRFTFQGYFFFLAIFVGFFLWFLPFLSFAVLLISHDPFWLFCTTFEATLKWMIIMIRMRIVAIVIDTYPLKELILIKLKLSFM